MTGSLHRLYLVRHGDTEWSDTHRHTGLTDIPLNSQGEQQARNLGKKLASLQFTRCFTSPLLRAAKTCKLAGFAETAESDADLLEWNYGDYEGRTTSAIRAEREGWNVFLDGCPNGEMPGDVMARADRFIAKVRGIPGDVVAFSSAHIIRVITARWLGLEPQAGRFFLASTAAFNILGYEHDKNEPVICLWNE